VLEDDVLPARNWEKRLHEAVNQIESEHGDDYILALYTPYDKLPEPLSGRCYTRYPAYAFFGTQAMYYPDPSRRAFAEYLKDYGVETFRTHYDLLLSEYLRFTGIPLFVTTPCLFEHVGDIGTGLAPFFHRAGRISNRKLNTAALKQP
jgi:hypothetical protein